MTIIRDGRDLEVAGPWLRHHLLAAAGEVA
jgi:hypothetical protein